MVKVTLKWGKETFNDVELDVTDSVDTFQLQIYSLTRVPPERQKILGIPGGPLKPGEDLSKRGVKEGCKVMLVGTAEEAELKEPAEKIKFAEDMTPEEIAKVLNEQAKGPLPVGLVNLGNTCYMNSCVQLLRQVPELKQALSAVRLDGQDMNVDARLSVEFAQLLRAMESSIEPVQPLRFLVALRAKVPSFGERDDRGNPRQQDAEECVRNLLASFAAATTKEGVSNAVDELFGFQTRSVYKCMESEEEPQKVDVTTDRFLFCHFGSVTEPISHVREGIKLSLKEYVEKNSETLGRIAQYEKTAALSSLPQYLMVQFARFGWKKANSEAGTSASRVKIGREVKYPKRLDLFEFCTENLQKELTFNRQKDSEQRDREWDAAQKALKEGTNLEVAQVEGVEKWVDTGAFELVAVVSHQGRSAEGGHYVGWAISEKADGKKKKEDTWLLFDDDKVSERPEKAVDLAGGRLDTHIAYFVLYKKAPSRIVEVGQTLGSSTTEAPASGSAGGGSSGTGGDAGADAGPKPMDVDG